MHGEGREPDLSSIIIILVVLCVLFRKPLGRMFARQFPDRAKRRRVAGTIILAFVLVFGFRLLALLWK